MFHILTIFLVYLQEVGVISWPWWGVVAPSIFILSLWGLSLTILILLAMIVKLADQ